MGTRIIKNRYLALILFLLNSVFILSAPTIEIIKSNISGIAQSNLYDNGEQILYKVRINNPDSTNLNNIKVAVPLSLITANKEGGGTGLVFSNLTNQIKGTSVNANAGIISTSGDFLASGVDIPAGGYVEYYVLGTINPLINGPVTVTVNVTNNSGNINLATGTNTLTRVPYVYTLVKSSPISYYEKEGSITYKIAVTNTGTTTIKDFTLNDNLPTELTGASITGTATGGSNLGSFSSSGDLIATGISITPGNKVEYTITANVKPGVTTPIVNTASSTVRNQTETSNTITLNLATYDFSIQKTVSPTNYTPNQNLTYKVRISNNSSTIPITKMKIEDVLSTITATAADGSTKMAFDSSTITITATSTGTSNPGTFASSGDLNATNVTIGTNSYVEYTIIGKVKADIVGPIINTAKATDRNGVEKTSVSNTTSVAPTLNLTKTANKTTYRPGETIVYTVTVENTGAGIASNYLVEDLLTSITGNVGNTGGILATNVNPSPLFQSWTTTAVLGSGSTKSLSAIITNGGTTSNTDLLDIVTVFPGEKIIYTITGVTKDSSIGNIANKVDLKKNSVVQKTATSTTTAVTLANNSSVIITKVPTELEYKPGDVITYTITVRNPNNNFMDNLTIKDLLSSITATQIDGTTGPAFDSWDLSVSSTTGIGTVPGTGAITNGTGNLILTADIGPNGSIVYQIKAKTKLTTVGTIIDTVSTGGDNVPELGAGVKMASPVLEVAKNVDTTEYIPGGTLTYTIDVDNPGDGYAVNVRVKDLLSTITTTLIDGTTGPAYNSWNIISKIYNISSGTPVLVTGSDPSSAGTYSPTEDLNITDAIIGPNRRITYTIVAVVNPKAKGTIKNLARVNDVLYSDKGSITRDSRVSISKNALTTSYVAGGDTTVQYEVIVSNSSTAGVALGVKVEDKITDISTALLTTGNTNPFSSWTISAPILSGPETKSTLIGPLNNVNLVDTVDISPGGFVKYIITGTLKTPTDDNVIYGPIANTAKADGLTSTATINPKLPNLVTSKTAISGTFIPGNTVSFKVVVKNTGNGYANDTLVKDILDTTYFEDISISGIPTGIGTTTGIIGVINTDLDAVVDIAPGGTIEYTVVARVKTGYNGKTVSNTVEVTDTQNNLTTTTSATITKNGGSGNLIDFIKRSDTSTFAPGGTITYYIDVVNRLGSSKTVTVKDFITNIKATYANDLSVDNVTDMPNQQAFTSWVITKGENTSNPTISVGNNVDLNDTVTISANSTMTYKIVGTVSERVITPQLTNIATLLEGATTIGTSSVQHNIIPPGGGITRSVDKSVYIPGVDTLKYTITVNSTGPGYQNNISINELIKNLSVDLIDGTTGNPFVVPETGAYNFTVKKIITGETDGTEEVFTQGILNNENLVGVVDVKPGEKVQYVIEGVVRKDAIGEINNNGLITEPFRYNLQNTKSVLPNKYEPGQYITYTITLRNNSKGNAKDILVEDNFNAISVLDSTGATIIPALTDVTVDTVNSIETGYKANLGNPTIVNGKLTATPDIPIGGTIVYKIKAKVNEKAVGFLTNVVTVDGDAVSNQVGPTTDKPEIKKEILNFYRPDGTTVINGGKYMPGGFIEYKITLTNSGKGILNNGTFVDDLGAITTAYSTGVTGPAFDNWTITRVSSTGISTIPDINNSIVLNTSTTKGINTLIDLHPNGEIIYTVKAKINEKAVGNITNTASLNGQKSTITSTMQSATINHTKEAYVVSSDGSSLTNTVKTTFLPGEYVGYKIVVENTGLGTSYLKTYKDLVGSIIGEVAETATSGEAPTAPVFESYTATYNYIPANPTVTTIGTFNQTIDLTSMVTIAPLQKIEFIIIGLLKDTVIGKFTNTSTYDGNVKTKQLSAVAPTIMSKKSLVKLNGVPFTAGMTYSPGDSVEYEVTIENTGSSFYNDLTIGDNIDSIVTSLTGDTTGNALENVVISAPVVTNSLSKPVLTNIKSKPGNSPTNLQVEVDLAPKDKIVYKITGNIVKSAIGTIPANVVNVGGTNYPSDPINPKAPNIVSKKELIAPTNKIYGPNEVVEYKLTIENTGEGYGNDIKIIDEISKIKTTLLNGSLGQAFTSWIIATTITHTDTSYNNQTILQNTLTDNVDINTEIDIAPTGKVEIIIKATTSSLAAGSIINIAKINNVDKPSEQINPRTATVEFYKLPLVTGITTYAPNGDIGFRLVLVNTSTDAIAKDINLVDIVTGIKVQSSTGGTVQAFQPGWTLETVSISGDSTRYSTTGIGTNGDITSGKVTLGPGETLVIRIKGKATNTAIGDIVNTANATYNGVDLGPKTVTLTPQPGLAELTKSVNKTEYTPGGKIIYTIVVKNTGTGYLNDISIVDDLSLLQTQLAGGTTGQAITSFTQVTLAKTNPATIITRDMTYTDGYKAIGDIYPGDTVTIVLEATVNELAAGPITNIAKINDSNSNKLDEDTKTVNTLPANIKILKSVDKAVYISEDTLTYTITLGNTGTGWANGIKVIDEISSITADIGGTNTAAFASWSISWITKPGSAQDAIVTGQSFPVINTDLNASVSLAPLSGIDFKIVAKLKSNTTTDIKNEAQYKYDPSNPINPTTPLIDSNEVITSPKTSKLLIKKEQNNIRERSGFTAGPVQYWLNDVIEYKIIVSNPEAVAVTGIEITDNIKNILVEGSGGDNIPAFTQWSIQSITYSGGGTPASVPTSITPSVGAPPTSDSNIKVVTGLKANEMVEIVIRAQITSGIEDNFPQSVIKNTASLVQTISGTPVKENSNEVIFTPYPPVLERDKVITSIGGVPYTSGMTYEPGQTVIYTISVRNTGNGVADNVAIKDSISSVVAELAGGTIASPFLSWTIAIDKSPATKVEEIIPIAPNNNIDLLVDLGPDKYINVVISAVIRGDVVGTISPNIAVINGGDDPTPPIPPKEPIAPSLTKTIVEGSSYLAGGIIKYDIVLINPNTKQWLNDVNVIDSISTVFATNLNGDSVKAFKDGWTITKTDLNKGTIYSNTYPITNANLNETMDLAPGDKVIFTITATVNDNIVGDIINKVTGSYVFNKSVKPLPESSVTSTSAPGTAKITKTEFEEFYTPGGPIGYDIVIENTSTENLIDDLKIFELISGIKASKIGETEQVPAFKAGWTITYQVVGDTVNTNATTIPSSGDINGINIDIGKSTKIIVRIRGTAEDGIYGNILNTAHYEYLKGIDGNKTGSDDATIKPKDPILNLVKSVSKPTYSPTDEILYTLEIENTGTGPAIGVKLTDDIGLLKTDLAGSTVQGKAFTSWTRESAIIPSTSIITTETLSGDIYAATLNIAPGDKVIITLKGILDPKAYGEIDNIANVIYKNGKNEEIHLKDNAITKGDIPKLRISKQIDKEIYEDKDTIIFTLVVQNGGLGWGNDILIEDKISEIVDDIVGPAFESWTITTESSSALSSILPSSLPANTDLSATIDIAPISQIKFIITAKLKENVSSTIKNTATLKDKDTPPLTSNEVVANPLDGDLSIIKSVEQSNYSVPGKLTYVVKVTNNNNILARDVLIEDFPNAIKVSTTKDGVTINPFASWKLVSVVGDAGSVPSTVIPPVPSIGANPSTTNVAIVTNIKAKETITLIIEADINEGTEEDGEPIGVIENGASATYKEKKIYDSVRVSPGDPILMVEKVIKTIAGSSFNGQNYESGDVVVYEIKISNTGSTAANNVKIDDKISTLQTELAGEIIGSAFQSWTTLVTKSHSTTSITPSLLVPPNTDISLEADISAGDTVVIEITAKINSAAVGTIPKNIVTANEIGATAPEIKPKKGDLKFTKEIIDGSEYTQGGTIKYKLTIANSSNTFINDISFKDELSKITAKALDESFIAPFQTFTVTRTDNGTGTTYTQSGNLTDEDINTKIDLSPKDVVVYTVTATVKGNIVGDIENNGFVEYEGPDEVVKLQETVVSTTVPGNITIFKEPSVKTYAPNGPIGFNVIVSNTSTSNVANNVLVRDIITDILANKVGGGTTQAFKPGWTITSRLEGDDIANSNIDNLNALTAGVNIDNVSIDLGKNTKVIIEIRGFAESNIYGQIRNTAYFEYPDGNQSGKFDPPIDNIPSIPTLTKFVDKSNYVSGETLTYTIEIENPGESVIPNFVLEDAIGTITAEISGGSTATGLAFSSWEKVSLVIPDSSALISEEVKNSTEGTTYTATFDLAPGDKVILTVAATTMSNVFGQIKNTAVGKYIEIIEGQPVSKETIAEAISVGKLGKLGIEKTTNTEFYEPGQEVEYTVRVTNNGDGWIRNAILEDNFAEITTILFGNDIGLAFDITSMVISYTTDNSENSVTILDSVKNLKAEIDIKNDSSITFSIKIKISTLAAFRINNVATITIPPVGEDEPEIVTSNLVKIDPLPPEVTLVKTVDLANFENESTLIYTIVIENIGKTNINNIIGKDILKDITAMNNLGQMVYPFQSGIIVTKEILPENSVIVTPTDESDGVILDNLSLKPGAKIIYTVTAKVIDGIVGNIINTATAEIPSQTPDGNPQTIESTVSSTPFDPTLTVEKMVTTDIENDNGIINGELVTYTIKIGADRPVFNVQVVDEISNIKTTAGEEVFNLSTIKLVSVQENGVTLPYTGDINSTSSKINIPRINSEATIVIQAKVSDTAVLVTGEELINTVSLNFDQNNDGTPNLTNPLEAFVVVIPKAPQLEILKSSLRNEILLGDEIEYTIKITNIGVGRATNFTIVDNISDITATSNSDGKIPVYTEWLTTGVAGTNSSIGTLPTNNTNINITDAEIAPGESLTYTVKAKTSLNLNVKEVENTALIRFPGLPDQTSKATVKIKKPLVTIDKEAGVRETSIGKFVPYSLLVTNNENQTIMNIFIKDTPPAGFSYVDGSLQIVQNGEKIGTIPAKYVGDTVVVGPFHLSPKQQIEVVYLTKVSLGVVRGVYKNTAVVTNTSGTVISNEDTAEVDVVEDPLFETTTVIGKVFHDRDGDGTQDDNRATEITVTQNIPDSAYVPNSTFYVIDGLRKPVPDRSVPLNKGIKIKEILYGRMSEREALDKNKLEIYTGLNDVSSLGNIRVTTDEGTDITLTNDNKVITNHTGLKKKGMVSQNIVIKRDILKRNTNKNQDNKVKYYERITIVNTGLIEEGFPGVRVANIEGLVAITDQYGRFHIPEVSDEKGKNYILKVDPATLPAGTIFTTENPKVQRLGSTIIKYNFGVVLPRTTYETEKDGGKLLRTRIYPRVIFYDDSSELKPVVTERLFESIKSRLKIKDHLLLELNTSKNQKLDKERKDILLKTISEYFKDQKIDVKLIEGKKEGK